MKKILNVALFALALFLVLVAFGISTAIWIDFDKIAAEDVRVAIEGKLTVGADTNRIESFFERHDLPYDYDRYANRYQSIIRDVSRFPWVDKAIVIYIYVDHEKKFVRAEVRESLTFL